MSRTETKTAKWDREVFLSEAPDGVQEVAQKVATAIDSLIDRDTHLLEFDVNERSITHMLGVYLWHQFMDSGYDVDCEYNRNMHDPKRLPTASTVAKWEDIQKLKGFLDPENDYDYSAGLMLEIGVANDAGRVSWEWHLPPDEDEDLH